MGAHRAGTALRGKLTAVGLHLLHDGAPSAPREHGVTRGEAGFEEELVEAAVVSNLAFDFKDALRGVAIFGVWELLFSGAGILQVIGAAAAAQVALLLNRRMIGRTRVAPLRCSGDIVRV